MRIAALDIGDSWTGIALSDAAGILAKPYDTVASKELIAFLTTLLTKETISTIVVGYPKTMQGTESAQTKKVLALWKKLQETFPGHQWILWDERLSSKRAQTIQKNTSKEEKKRSHAVAAAFILHTYLDYLHHHNKTE